MNEETKENPEYFNPESQVTQSDQPEQGSPFPSKCDKNEHNAASFFAKIRELLKEGHSDEARTLVANNFPKTSIWSFSDIGKELCGIVDAHLDAVRHIIWVTGDIGVALAGGWSAYPYDLYGRHLQPTDIVDCPSNAWWGYSGRVLKFGHMCPIGLGVHLQQREGWIAHLLDAPGDGTLVFEDDKGHRYRIDYNGNMLL